MNIIPAMGAADIFTRPSLRLPVFEWRTVFGSMGDWERWQYKYI
jgi:hypothetical protein